MRVLSFCGTVFMALSLTACETADQKVARQTQFNGQPLADVIAVIGKPNLKTATKAQWSYRETRLKSSPVYGHINGKLVVTGYFHDPYQVSCTYTAKLKNAYVIASTYEGQDCLRYAPKRPSS